VTLDGYDTLDRLFHELPRTHDDGGDERFEMYVDRTYNVTGVGTVASGTVKRGEVTEDDTVYLGPKEEGGFEEVEVRSIEMHYHRVERAKSGNIVGIALKNVDEEDVERGMVLSSEPKGSVREFRAEVMVLNHPTRIRSGYEPVVHLETISEATVFEPCDGHVLPGETDEVDIRFKFRPYSVEEGQRFVFREGKSKGVGTVKEITERE
ncbi:MAG: EF-Tu/IF-2/RF-3 family GTPase, partial [Halobacteria archaeon]|nr:EF-Tu/IF-2/RF-3 family GTPase [Halobacteria archaeon]